MKFCSTMHYKSMSALFSVCCEIEGNGKKGLEKHFRKSAHHREKNRMIQLQAGRDSPKIKQTCCGKSKPRTLDILLKIKRISAEVPKACEACGTCRCYRVGRLHLAGKALDCSTMQHSSNE